MSMRSKFRPTGKPRDTHEAVARLQREVATAFDALYVDLNAVQAAGAACCEANEAAAIDDHGDLNGLDGDDHTQYLLAAGTRALTGNWDAGSFNITAQSLTADTGNVEATNGEIVATDVTYTGTDADTGKVLRTNGAGATSFANTPFLLTAGTAVLPVSNPATRTTDASGEEDYLSFPDGSATLATWNYARKSSGAATFTINAGGSASNAGADASSISISIDRRAPGGAVIGTRTYDTINTQNCVTDATANVITQFTFAIPEANMDDAVAGDQIRIRISRDGAGDAYAGAFRVIGVEVDA